MTVEQLLNLFWLFNGTLTNSIREIYTIEIYFFLRNQFSVKYTTNQRRRKQPRAVVQNLGEDPSHLTRQTIEQKNIFNLVGEAV